MKDVQIQNMEKMIQQADAMGWEVIKSKETSHQVHVVLVYREGAPFKGREYSTHGYNEIGGGGFFSGRYDKTEEEAERDFAGRDI
jgi:hypothetical protein